MDGATKKILIIEDDADYADYYSVIIERAELGEVKAIHDGISGLKYFLENPPDCLILDLDLPLLRGEDILRIIRSMAQYRDIPIIISSGISDSIRQELNLLKIGADAYLAKPFVDEVLLDTVADLFNKTKPLGADPAAADDKTPLSVYSGTQEKKYDDTMILKPEETQIWDTSGKKSDSAIGYKIIDLIGGGLTGTIYKAEQTDLERLVCLKILPLKAGKDPEVYELIKSEAKSLAKLDHKNIVKVFDFGKTSMCMFIAREFIEGVSLSQRIKQGRMPNEQCIMIIEQVSDALIYLHSKGIIHGNIKPTNIMVTGENNVKLTDLGMFGIHRDERSRQFSDVMNLLGADQYAALELLSGNLPNEKSDQYSLGLTFWCMFSRQTPKFANLSLSQFRRDLPESLSDYLARMMSSDPKNRFDSIKDAKDHILSVLK